MSVMSMDAWGPNSVALASLNLKLQVSRDWVTAVATGLQTGLYMYGAGGIGKSHTVLDQLAKLGVEPRLFNSRMTGKGLFRALQAAPDSVHLLEDMERLVSDRDAQGVLRSALWAAKGRDRVVTWTTAAAQETFTFRGGIILISNRPFASLPELRALATRIAVYRLEATDEELAALLHELVAAGYERDGKSLLQAETCVEIAFHLLTECRDASCPLDLRLLFNAYHDYLLWESDQAGCHWHDLVSARARETAAGFKHQAETLSSEERKANCRQTVRDVMLEAGDNVAEQIRLYRKRTGKSRADFFRRKREVESGEFDPEVLGGSE